MISDIICLATITAIERPSSTWPTGMFPKHVTEAANKRLFKILWENPTTCPVEICEAENAWAITDPHEIGGIVMDIFAWHVKDGSEVIGNKKLRDSIIGKVLVEDD